MRVKKRGVVFSEMRGVRRRGGEPQIFQPPHVDSSEIANTPRATASAMQELRIGFYQA